MPGPWIGHYAHAVCEWCSDWLDWADYALQLKPHPFPVILLPLLRAKEPERGKGDPGQHGTFGGLLRGFCEALPARLADSGCWPARLSSEHWQLSKS